MASKGGRGGIVSSVADLTIVVFIKGGIAEISGAVHTTDHTPLPIFRITSCSERTYDGGSLLSSSQFQSFQSFHRFAPFKTLQLFNRFAPFITGISPFQAFQSSIALLRSKRFH